MNPLEVVCASRVIDWTAGHLVSKTSECPSRDKGRGMNDSWCVSANTWKSFPRFGITVENSLGGSLDVYRDSSGDLEYREKYSETYAPAQWLSKNVIMSTQGRRTAHVFYEPKTPSIPPATGHIPDIPHPISDLPSFFKFFSPAYLSSGLGSSEDLFPGVRPSVAGTAFDNQSDILCGSSNYGLCTPSYCTRYCGM